MRNFAITILGLVSLSLTVQASPSSDAMKSFLNSRIGEKSVSNILCKWEDPSVTGPVVLQVKKNLMVLLPQLGIPALQDISTVKATDLQVSGSPSCAERAYTFAVTTQKFSIRAFIDESGAEATYRIGVNNLNSKDVLTIYKQAESVTKMGLGLNAMDNIVKAINQKIVPISLKPQDMTSDEYDGVKSININFASIAKSGELYSLSLMDNGDVMFMNQLNVDLNTQGAATGKVETYTIQSVARCICKASMSVQSESGKVGSVLNSQKVASIKLAVGGKEVVLKNPPKGIRSYYAGAERDSWVLAELLKQKVKVGPNDSIDLISFTGSLTLFEDFEGSNPVQN
jgi:hypothetical protein